MMDFLSVNSLYMLSALVVVVAFFLAFRWASMPVLQRFTALMFVGVVAHIWEETRLPGGFIDLISSKLGFTASNSHVGELFTAALVLLVVFVPLLLPRVTFLSMAAMLLGIMEAVAHTAAIFVFKLDHFYSPGMVTAVFLLLPIAVLGISYAVRHHLMTAVNWALALLHLLVPLILAQQIVVRASGMPYMEFLKNLRAHF